MIWIDLVVFWLNSSLDPAREVNHTATACRGAQDSCTSIGGPMPSLTGCPHSGEPQKASNGIERIAQHQTLHDQAQKSQKSCTIAFKWLEVDS